MISSSSPAVPSAPSTSLPSFASSPSPAPPPPAGLGCDSPDAAAVRDEAAVRPSPSLHMISSSSPPPPPPPPPPTRQGTPVRSVCAAKGLTSFRFLKQLQGRRNLFNRLLPSSVRALLARIARTAPAVLAVPALVLSSAGEYSCRLAAADGYVSDYNHPRQHISYTFGYRHYYAANEHGGGGGTCVRTSSDYNESWEHYGYKFAGWSTFFGAAIVMFAVLLAIGKPPEPGSTRYAEHARLCGMVALSAIGVSLFSLPAAFSAFSNPICLALEGGQGCALGPMGQVALAGSACWMAAGLAIGIHWIAMESQMEGRHEELVGQWRRQQQQRPNEAQEDEHERLVVFDGRVPAHARAADNAENGFIVPSPSSLLAGNAPSKEGEAGDPAKVQRIEMVAME